MNTLKVFLAASGLALFSFGSAHAQNTSTATCSPVQKVLRTEFPQQSQQAGEFGTVRLAVRIGADGRASDVQVRQSSGYRSLDRAAENSVRNYWVFDVAHCTTADLQAFRTVGVQFQRAALQTVSHTVNHRVAALEKKLLSAGRCDVTRDSARNAVFACVQNEVVADNANLVRRTAVR